MQRCQAEDHDDPAGYFWIIRRPQITIISLEYRCRDEIPSHGNERATHKPRTSAVREPGNRNAENSNYERHVAGACLEVSCTHDPVMSVHYALSVIQPLRNCVHSRKLAAPLIHLSICDHSAGCERDEDVRSYTLRVYTAYSHCQITPKWTQTRSLS